MSCLLMVGGEFSLSASGKSMSEDTGDQAIWLDGWVVEEGKKRRRRWCGAVVQGQSECLVNREEWQRDRVVGRESKI